MIQNINNGAVTGQKSMPQKDITSNGESQFQIARHVYSNTHLQTPLTQTEKIQKKWYGNRDASQIIANRRTTSVGVGSFNASGGLYSMTTYQDKNYENAARSRVRSGGAVAPAKKGSRPVNY
jgi:hypothetical protein